MSFKAPGFKEILNYSGKEFLQEDLKIIQLKKMLKYIIKIMMSQYK